MREVIQKLPTRCLRGDPISLRRHLSFNTENLSARGKNYVIQTEYQGIGSGAVSQR